MHTVAIVAEAEGEGVARFRALSGGRQSVGRTMGEALDALTAQITDDDSSALIIIQKKRPDRFFSAQQQQRMQELMDRRNALTIDEREELEALIDAELDATIARTDALVKQLAP